jgi:hypothetical protein
MAAGAPIRLPLPTARLWPVQPPTDLLKAFTQEREGKRGGRLKRGLSLRGVEGSNGCKPFVPGTVQSDPESLPNSKESARS